MEHDEQSMRPRLRRYRQMAVTSFICAISYAAGSGLVAVLLGWFPGK
ncbi:hypothetical protein ABZ686_21365 [Streptomyces sp. NPDC006992]